VVDKQGTMPINPLHDARVRRGISLHTIASTTRLSPWIVEALDTDRLSDIPAGLYARAYVRAFAKAVDLDPDATLAMLGDRLPSPVELSPEFIEQVRSSPQPSAGAVTIVRDAAIDIALLVGVSVLLVVLVSEYCGLPFKALVRLAPGPMVGLCAPVWVLYEILLGRVWAYRIFWSGNSFLIPSSMGILSVCGVRPRPAISRFSSSFNSASFRAAAGSLMRFTRSPGSFLRS
jgi:Helix-turn-helix domain